MAANVKTFIFFKHTEVVGNRTGGGTVRKQNGGCYSAIILKAFFLFVVAQNDLIFKKKKKKCLKRFSSDWALPDENFSCSQNGGKIQLCTCNNVRWRWWDSPSAEKKKRKAGCLDILFLLNAGHDNLPSFLTPCLLALPSNFCLVLFVLFILNAQCFKCRRTNAVVRLHLVFSTLFVFSCRLKVGICKRRLYKMP